MAEISGVYSPPVYTPSPVESAPPPVDVAPVELIAPEVTNLASEMGIGANIDVYA